MYRIYFVNHGYYAQEEHSDLDSAKAHCKRAGFDSRIDGPDGAPVAVYSILSGFRTL